MKRQRRILHFDDINQAHAAMGFSGRTDLPDFHVFTLEATYPSTRRVMPPYTFRFYCLTFFDTARDATLELDAERLGAFNDTIAFQPPGRVSSWTRGEAQRGYILYFQPEFLSHHPIPLTEEFPFFHSSGIVLLPLAPAEKVALRDHFARLDATFGRRHAYRAQMLQAHLLALLFDCKGLYEGYRVRQQRPPDAALSLAARFQQLVERDYLIRQSVREYAERLGVTPNHLSQAVSQALGRPARDVIADRLTLEAKRLLRYSDLGVAEIARYLGFEQPTHFTRFFRRRLALTPLAYRRRATGADAERAPS